MRSDNSTDQQVDQSIQELINNKRNHNMLVVEVISTANSDERSRTDNSNAIVGMSPGCWSVVWVDDITGS